MFTQQGKQSGMYGKLFARITESSLMEESIPVRYTFAFMIAIADPEGYVIGTDVAIARRLNMPLKEFQACLAVLMAEDNDSNSKEQGGRRVVPSDGERGYFLVNYRSYRDTKDQKDRREYMREYMRDYRKEPKNSLSDKDLDESVNNVNTCKQVLASPSPSTSTSTSPNSSHPAYKKNIASIPEDNPLSIKLADGVYEFPQVWQIPSLVRAIKDWANHLLAQGKAFCTTNLESLLIHHASAKWSAEKLERGIRLSLSKSTQSTIIDPDEASSIARHRSNSAQPKQASTIGEFEPRKKKAKRENEA